MSEDIEPDPLIIGWWTTEENAASALRKARSDQMDFVVTPIESTVRNDLHLSAQYWRTSIVGQSHTIDMDLTWAFHMNLPAVILPKPDQNLTSYAQCAQRRAIEAQANSCQLWVPITFNREGYSQWQRLLALCDHHSNLGVLLCFDNDYIQEKWKEAFHLLHLFIGLSLRAVSFESSQNFITNNKGYPVLSKATQVLFEEVLRRVGRSLRVLIHGKGNGEIELGETLARPHVAYLQHFRQARARIQEALDTSEARMEQNYLDVLQSPLQPLKDHLEFNTYETFEKDPIKYSQYQKAISMALQDRKDMQSCALFVLGAGRGPLMDCALRAYNSLDASCRPNTIVAVAVEKNPSAVVYLRSLVANNSEWSQVSIVASDIRSLRKESIDGTVADIVVSELLGSFGCNELSPECLDGFFATDVVGPNTISIPSRYASQLSPVSSLKLLNEVRSRALYPTPDMSKCIGNQAAFETPYVVRSHAASQTHAAQDCWEFTHPSSDSSRYRRAHLTFDHSITCENGSGYPQANAKAPSIPFSSSWTLTGLLGSFTAELYRNQDEVCSISIDPRTFSEGMFSWFPLLFPIREPLMVPEGASVSVDIWRLVDDDSRKVWYEWCVSVEKDGVVLASSSIHNPNGRSYYVES